jgi:hypothetical protein
MFTRRAWLLLAIVAGCGGAGARTDAGAIDTPPAIDAAPPRVAVLFVGTSFTYAWEVPKVAAAIAPAAAPIDSTMIATGGASLQDHWLGEARPAIEAGGHDAVVLQGQSLEPIFDPDNFALHADRLAGAAAAADARVVFFGTWARRAGDPIYENASTGGTPDAMQDLLTAGYAAAAARNGGALAPVGEGFRLVIAEHPEVDVLHPDGSHASPAGAYLAACLFVELLTGELPTDVAQLDLDAPTRAILRDAAHRALASAR